MEIFNPKNTKIYNSTLSCANGKVCEINYDKTDDNYPLTFKFFDNKNKLISAYILLTNSGHTSYITIDSSSLGIYVFEQLNKVQKTNPVLLNDMLIKFFSKFSPSPDNKPDIFEELGLYYVAKVNVGNLTEEQFYTSLHNDISKSVPLNQNALKVMKASTNQHAMVMTASTSKVANTSTKCTASVSDISRKLTTLSSVMPSPGGAAISFINSAMTYGCNQVPTISDVMAQLNTMNNKLNALGYQLDAITDLIHKNQMTNDYVTIQNAYIQVNNVNNAYAAWLFGHPGYLSIADYVKAQKGGLKAVMANPNETVIHTLLTSISSQKSNYENLVNTTRM